MCYTTEIKEQELAKYATAVAASPDGVAVGEDGAPVEEEEKDEENFLVNFSSSKYLKELTDTKTAIYDRY